ncbi:MAG: ATP-binding cassette domain-containing protein [Gemmatimonadetes bacterium]|nr:ATP-binding cassette domain-containing protein [Gemmatimonadota bacterium]
MPPTPDSSEEDVLGKAYDARLARRLLRYAWPYRALIASSLALLVIDGALQLVGPLLTRRVIDVAIPAGDATAILHAALLFGGTLLAQFGCTYGETVLTARLGQRVMHDLRTQLFAHLQRLPVAYFDRNPVGRLVTRVTSDVESLNELFTSGVVAGLGDVFTLLAISILMLVVDWRLALAAFAVIPLVVIASNVFRVRVREAYRAIRTRLARINAFLQERLSGVRVVQLFGREGDEARRFDALNKDHLDAHLTSITIYALYFPIIELLTTIAIAAILVAGAARVDLATLSVGTVAAFLQLVRRFFEPLQDLSDKYNTLQQAMAASERIFALLDEESDVRRATGDANAGALGASATGRALPAQSTDSPRASTTPGDGGAQSDPRLRSPVSIEFRHVWFAYAAPHAAAGDTVDRPPEWVLRTSTSSHVPGALAIVGHTGAGKTTIINLLLGFYQPQRGEILDQRDRPARAPRGRRAAPDRLRAAGHFPVRGRHRLQHPAVDAAHRCAGARRGDTRGGRSAGAATPRWVWLRARRTREFGECGRATAPVVRARDRGRSRRPCPRRSDQCRGQRDRGGDPASVG